MSYDQCISMTGDKNLTFPSITQSHQWRSGNSQNWKTGSARFKPRSRLSAHPFGVFRGFLRNSGKYGLGSLRKTPTEGTPPIGPGPTSGQLILNQQPTNRVSHNNVVSVFEFKIRVHLLSLKGFLN